MQTQATKRLQNFELLRVILMFLILVGHYFYWGLGEIHHLDHFNILHSISLLDYATMQPIKILASVGVNCFVMISGYFLIKRNNFRLNSLLKLWVQILFYSLLFYFCLDTVSFQSVNQFLFPIYSQEYWFMTMYFGLILLSPFLSILANAISKKTYIIMLLLLYILFSGYGYGNIYVETYVGGSSLLWYSFVFLLAGYYKLHGLPSYIIRHSGTIVLLLLIVGTIMAGSMNYIQKGSMDFHLKTTSNSEFIFFLSFFFFLHFSKLNIKNKFLLSLSKLAPYSLGVYLIHEHSLVRELLWGTIPSQFFKYPLLIHCLIVTITIYLICILIDLIRDFIFHKSGIYRFCYAISNWIDKKIPPLV